MEIKRILQQLLVKNLNINKQHMKGNKERTLKSPQVKQEKVDSLDPCISDKLEFLRDLQT